MCLALSALANWIEKRGRRAKTGIKVAEADRPSRPDAVARDLTGCRQPVAPCRKQLKRVARADHDDGPGGTRRPCRALASLTRDLALGCIPCVIAHRAPPVPPLPPSAACAARAARGAPLARRRARERARSHRRRRRAGRPRPVTGARQVRRPLTAAGRAATVRSTPRAARTVRAAARHRRLAGRLGCRAPAATAAPAVGSRCPAALGRVATRRRQQLVQDVGVDARRPRRSISNSTPWKRPARRARAREAGARRHPAATWTSLEQDASGVTAHTRPRGFGSGVAAPGAPGTWWRGSYLVGCDGARSTVRKLLGVPFAGRTAVERHAVAALRTELPWDGEAVLDRALGGMHTEVTARPLPDGVWRLDWLLPPRGELVTPDALLDRVRATPSAGWCGDAPPTRPVRTPGHRRAHLAPTARSALARGPRLPRRGRRPSGRRPRHAVGRRRAAGRRATSPGSWPWPGTTAPPTLLLDSYQAERRAPSPPGCAPPTRRCRWCGGGGGRCGARPAGRGARARRAAHRRAPGTGAAGRAARVHALPAGARDAAEARSRSIRRRARPWTMCR